jgi:hypothetical protein
VNIDLSLIVLEQVRRLIIILYSLSGVQQRFSIDLEYPLVQVLHPMLHRLVKMLPGELHVLVQN